MTGSAQCVQEFQSLSGPHQTEPVPRACMAIAISLRPQVIIADEPTSALDVVVQKQVMETLRRSQQDLHAAVILVEHDMGLMAQGQEGSRRYNSPSVR